MAKSNLVIAKSGKSHLSKDEKKFIEENTLKIENENEKIIAPSYLNKKMTKKFYELAEELVKLKIMTHLDCDTLAQYVFNLEQYEEISRILGNTPIQDESFIELAKLQEKYFKMCRASANEVGLNILSRSKLIPPTVEKKENKFSNI